MTTGRISRSFPCPGSGELPMAESGWDADKPDWQQKPKGLCRHCGRWFRISVKYGHLRAHKFPKEGSS